jgi:predicted NAD/FAD-binding protein
MRIAIVGAGVSGLVCAYLLHDEHEVTIFEADDRLGGHSHTVEVDDPDGPLPVDTGFIVFNPTNYPNFTRLLDRLGVASQPSSMGFSVRDAGTGLEYAGRSLDALFAQRRNLLRPGFYRMLFGILRFYREAPERLADYADSTLGEFLEGENYSREFIDHHLIPMGAALWSAGGRKTGEIPIRFFVEFFQNHGMLIRGTRPEWRTVTGGSREYVRALVGGFRDRIRTRTAVRSVRRAEDAVTVTTDSGGEERFDQIVLACHSDQSLGLLADPSPREREILGSIPYEENPTVLHTDVAVLPRNRKTWSSWNVTLGGGFDEQVAVTYLMNHLQSLRSQQNYCVTLNDVDGIDASAKIRSMTYHHPVFTLEGARQRAGRDEIDGQRRTHYCGAWWGNGFHEDGVASALHVCARFGKTL